VLTATIILITLICVDIVLRTFENRSFDRAWQGINSRLADINSKLGYSPDRALVETLKETSEDQRRFSDTLLEALMSDHEAYRIHKEQTAARDSSVERTPPQPTYNASTLTPIPTHRVMPPETDTVG
jgi:hypothetical protein